MPEPQIKKNIYTLQLYDHGIRLFKPQLNIGCVIKTHKNVGNS